ncbi:MAG: PorT family protein [Bryobacterales bacterium]|nr:PorT family protein [Bryobacterales bacterium]
MRTLAVFVLGLSVASAQELTVGGRFSLPLTRAFDPSQGTLSLAQPLSGSRSYDSEGQRLVAGPAMNVFFRRTRGLGIEIGALHQRLRFNGKEVQFIPIAPGVEGSRGRSWSTSASVWEFPLLLKYRIPAGAFRPYIVAGPSLSRVFDIGQSLECFDFVSPCRRGSPAGEPLELRRRAFLGLAIGAGVEFNRKHLVSFAPEVRYVHYGARHFEEPSGLIRSGDRRLLLMVGVNLGSRIP